MLPLVLLHSIFVLSGFFNPPLYKQSLGCMLPCLSALSSWSHNILQKWITSVMSVSTLNIVQTEPCSDRMRMCSISTICPKISYL